MLAAARGAQRAQNNNNNNSTMANKPAADGPSEAAILVAVRVRPFSSKEQQLLAKPPQSHFGPTARNFINYTEPTPAEEQVPKGAEIRKVVHTIDDHVLVFDPPDENNTRRATVGASNKRYKDIRFVFDRVYGEEATQRDLYEGTTRGLLDSVMTGYNATVFAYGATGCGKTYTISGCPEDPGVIFLTMQELFERVNSEDDKTVEITLSYLEVYNETIRDLLVDNPDQVPLALREDAKQSVTVVGLSQHVPQNVDEIMALMVRGNANRTMSPTEANAVSSRSHAVLQVHVRQKPRAGGLQTDVTSATLSIIDLAGSERATVARNNGARMREGANINRSLLALANCINALCDHKTKRHIPYRDSKLTRMLKFSLGGNCRTVMITCVSPASTYYEETHNTLKYANRAKNIKTTVARNTKSTQMHMAQYQGKIREQSEEIRRLQREVAALKSRPNPAAAPHASAQAMAELRKQTLAVQVVQDMRNKLASAYAPIREATWEHASALAVGAWYDRHIDALKGWRAQFETAFQEQRHLFADMDIDAGDGRATQALAFRQQVDELLRDLTRERKTVGRHAEHSAQLVERSSFLAERAAQVPPSVQLTAEQRYHVDQEHRVLDLSAERSALRRRVELGEHVAQSLAAQNTQLLRLTATCLCSLKRAIADIRTGGDGVERVVEQVYLQAIAGFSDVTAAVRASMKKVLQDGGPAKLQVDGSTLTPPSPYVPRIGASAAGSRNNNPAAISAAVAGTTRARRPVLSTSASAAPSNGSTNGSLNGSLNAPAPGRHMRTSPPKRTQAVLGRGAVRFNGPAPTTDSVRARIAARTQPSVSGNNSRQPTRPLRTTRMPAPTATATDNAVSVTSPVARKSTTFSVADNSSSVSLPSPTTSTGSISPVSSVGSWASAETSPHHEPLPAAARPLKSILKHSSVASDVRNGGSPEEGGGRAPGPVRLGSARRKSRQARMMSNPTARGPGTPTKPTTMFKSVGAAQPKKPVWR